MEDSLVGIEWSTRKNGESGHERPMNQDTADRGAGGTERRRRG
jgi:hypothetical protein